MATIVTAPHSTQNTVLTVQSHFLVLHSTSCLHCTNADHSAAAEFLLIESVWVSDDVDHYTAPHYAVFQKTTTIYAICDRGSKIRLLACQGNARTRNHRVLMCGFNREGSFAFTVLLPVTGVNTIYTTHSRMCRTMHVSRSEAMLWQSMPATPLVAGPKFFQSYKSSACDGYLPASASKQR